MTNKIYSYNPLTFQYIGEAIARRDPLEIEERFLIPAYATKKTPIFEDDKITKFVNGEWILENKPEPEPEPTPEVQLQEAKDSKKAQLLTNRKGANEKSMTTIQANEIIYNENGSFTTTTDLVNFAFAMQGSKDELTNPYNVLNACLGDNIIRYSCEILNPSRKGYIELTPAIASNILNHLIIRGETNVAHTNNLEKEIEDVEINDQVTYEGAIIALDNINIDF
jgi:hypothetical protein